MGSIAHDYFQQSPFLLLPVVALVIFMLVFVVVSGRALFSRKTRWEHVSRLPLESSDESTGGQP